MNGCPKASCTQPLCNCVTDENAPLPRADQPAPTPKTDFMREIGGKPFDAWTTADIQRVWLIALGMDGELSAAKEDTQEAHLEHLATQTRLEKAERELSAKTAEAERLKDRAEQAELDRDMWKAEVRRTTDEYVKTAREALAEAERLRKALTEWHAAMVECNWKPQFPEERKLFALAATRKEEGNG